MKILLALMQFDIGGAETHVFELAKELKRRGNDVTVASNGGVYVKELEEHGIRHFSVPLHTRSIKEMLRSRRLLKKIIKEENVGLVHSHARIPSFLLRGICKRMSVPFVTTAHWVFDTSHGLKYLTAWGQKTVAVSEDIKKYLIDNYDLDPRDIFVTINGIDTEKFSPETDAAAVREELGLTPDDKVIVYVSRLDEDRSLVAKQLIHAMGNIGFENKNVKAVIVGGGNDFENVKARAELVNADIGDRIILTGARTDISSLVSCADLFIGVSRAALEAMSAGKPTIIAGNEGYIGLFDESCLDDAVATNFCCRGCEQSSEERLIRDVNRFFVLDDNHKKALGDFARKVICESYSVARMCDDTVRAYEAALGTKSVVISGYYGFGNSGDDMLLGGIVNDLRGECKDVDITVLSNNVKETSARYGVRSVYRYNPGRLRREIKHAALFISGGGTLIQDATSTKSLMYYLYLIKLAKRLGKKVMLYASGIGPVKEKNFNRVRKVLNTVDVIALRDNDAKRELDMLRVTGNDIHITADCAFSLRRADIAVGKEKLILAGVKDVSKIALISVREHDSLAPSFVGEMAAFCDELSNRGYTAVFLPMQYERDYKISLSIIGKMRSEAHVFKPCDDAGEMLSVVANASLCVGMRLHSLIYAVSQGVRAIGISYDPKISGFLEYAGSNEYVNSDETTADKLISMLDGAPPSIDVNKLCNLSRENARLAVSLLEGGGSRE